MSNKVQDLIGRQKRLAETRRPWESHWQELAELLLPRRADFTSAGGPGEKRTDQQFDSVPMQAARGLAAALDGMLKSKSTPWFAIKAADDSLNRRAEVKHWLEQAQEIVYSAIYDPRARFLQHSAEVDLDLVVFGTGVMFVGERVGQGRLSFRSYHLSDIFLSENADGEIDTVFRRFRLTARQAVQKFSRDSIGDKIREALDENGDREFPFLHVVLPREERDPGRRDQKSMAFASIFIDVESEHMVSEGGYTELPYVIPRWDTSSDEIYGRSPGMLALPDAKTLNQMSKTILRAGHKMVDPPLLMPDDGVKSGPRTWPGGITYFDADVLARTGGRPPITPLVTGANIPLGREMQNDVREQVWSAFFHNVMQLPVEGPQMTATEIMQRKEEFLRVIGPTFGRLEADYTAPMITRAFNLLWRMGAFPPMPPALASVGVMFEYASPITRVHKQIESSALRKTVEDLSGVLQADPTVLDNFNHDRIVRDVAEANGLPQRWLVPEDQVEASRQKDQAALLQAAGTAAAAGAAGTVGPDLAGALPGLSSMLGAK